ncbi:MAG: polysaccharide deacetylase family protein [Bacteroidota bacterium]
MEKSINIIKETKMHLLIILLFLASCDKQSEETPFLYTEGTVRIAKWKGDKKAVVTLQFDDSTPGQATLGVPALNKRNIVGTWYINPGRAEFNTYINNWKSAQSGGQELANHTMSHTGASTYNEVIYEVGDASKIIWGMRGHENFGSLIAFNRGGGTSWNEDDLAKVLEEYKNIDRQSYVGIPVKALSVPSGSDANKMFEIVPYYLNDSIIIRIHFHGIAAENGNPPYDYGNGAVWINEFEEFLDKLVEVKDDIWIGGYIAVYKYIKERQTASISITQLSDDRFTIELTSEMDAKYYNEPLTILAYLPQEWEDCLIKHNGCEKSHEVQNNVLMFDAIPNKGEISLTKE